MDPTTTTAEERWNANISQYLFDADSDVDIVYDDEHGTETYERFVMFLEYNVAELFSDIRYHNDEVLLGLYVKNWKFFVGNIPDYVTLLKRLQEEWINVEREAGNGDVFDIEELCYRIGKSYYHNPIKAKLEWTLKDLNFYNQLNTEKTKHLMRQAKEVMKSFDKIDTYPLPSVTPQIPHEELMQKMEDFNHKYVHCYVVVPTDRRPTLSLIRIYQATASDPFWGKALEKSDSTEDLAEQMNGISIETKPGTSLGKESDKTPPPKQTSCRKSKKGS
uniref:Pre-mRNA-processing factor 39 n=1 Tax=Panagrellus redivivus TaxID=6233 RepID=A0A7E4VA46_PANRE